jgi:hypothetical protein
MVTFEKVRPDPARVPERQGFQDPQGAPLSEEGTVREFGGGQIA